MEEAIKLTAVFKQENPICAGFCEMINETLKIAPNLSLAEFAEQIDKLNKARAEKRLQAVVNEQLNEIFSKNF